MNNQQVASARKILNQFPLLNVTIGRIEAGETLTPYEKANVFNRGNDVIITANTSPAQIEAEFRSACLQLMATLAQS